MTAQSNRQPDHKARTRTCTCNKLSNVSSPCLASPALPCSGETLSQISKPTRTHPDHQPSPDWPPKQSRPSPAQASPGTSRKTSSPAKGTLCYTPQTTAPPHNNYNHAAHTPPASTRPLPPIKPTHRNPRADTIEQDMYGLKSSGHHGVQQWRARQGYKSFKSQYGPR